MYGEDLVHIYEHVVLLHNGVFITQLLRMSTLGNLKANKWN